MILLSPPNVHLFSERKNLLRLPICFDLSCMTEVKSKFYVLNMEWQTSYA